jgi:hypothetical protein
MLTVNLKPTSAQKNLHFQKIKRNESAGREDLLIKLTSPAEKNLHTRAKKFAIFREEISKSSHHEGGLGGGGAEAEQPPGEELTHRWT